MKVKIGLVIFSVVLTILFSACPDPSASSTTSTPGSSVPKYVVSSYKGNNNDRIKYSYTYGGYDFYYIYLGTLKGIPMFFKSARHHEKGFKETYEFSIEEFTESEIRKTVSQSSETTRSVTNENTKSKTSGQLVSAELTQTFGASFLKFYGVEASLKIGGEFNWSQITSETIVNSYQQSNSLTNTVEEAVKRAESSKETYTCDLTDAPTGYYRYTYFTACDVYLYVIRNSESEKVLYYEYREYPTNSDFWKFDYSETADFTKSDATSFEIDTSFLNNLPPPGTVTVTFDKNTTDKGSTEANPQEKLVTLRQKVGTLPAPPTRPEHTFVGWNTTADGKGTDFTPTTSVTGNMTVYAQWADFPSYTLTVNINPKDSGTVQPPSQSNVLPGTAVPIKAEPETGYKFTKWELVSGTATFGNANNIETTVTLNTDATIRANFQPNITLTLEQNITAGGTVSQSAKSNITPGVPVSISAIPNSGYKFKNWELVKGGPADILSSNNQSTTVTLKNDATIRANFELNEFDLTVERNPNWGTVTPKSGSYPANTKITITATSSDSSKYRFEFWDEPERKGLANFGNSKSASTTVILSGNVTISAYFLPKDAIFKGEIGQFSLYNPSPFVERVQISYLEDNGKETWKKPGGDILQGQTGTRDPGGKGYDIPDGSIVRLYSEVVWGNSKQGAEYFLYKKGSPKTAYYTHSGTTLSNKLTFDSVK